MRFSTLHKCALICALALNATIAAGDPQSKLYWTDTAAPPGTCKVRRSDLGGTNAEILVSGLPEVRGIAIDAIAGRMYWTESIPTPMIRSAKLDGTDPQGVVPVTDSTGGVAVDSVAQKIYWTEAGYNGQTPRIQRADVDGYNTQDLLIAGLGHPVGIAVDHVGGKIYWGDLGTWQIKRANLDGSGAQVVISSTQGDVNGLALDLVSGHLYWCVIPQPQSQWTNGSVWRANLDGTSDVPLFTGLTTPTTIAVDLPHGKVYWSNSWDAGNPGILWGNINGTGQPQYVPIPNAGQPFGIALGPKAPLHHYEFENGIAGTPATAPGSVLDSGEPVVHGTPQGGPLYRSDVPLLCSSNALSLEFDGVNDVVTFDSPFVFNAQFGDGTLEFWMKAPTQPHSNLIWGRGDGTDIERFHLYTGSAGFIGLDYREVNMNVRTLLPDLVFAYPLNTWMHFAATRTVETNGSHTYRFYRDGSLVHATSDVNPNPPATTAWTIAGRPPPHIKYQGLLDDIRTTDRALLPGEFLNAAPAPCTYCTAKVNSQGCTPGIGYTGVPSLTGPNNFHVTATNVLNNKFGLLFWGQAPANLPFFGGIRCVASPFLRTAAQHSGGNAGPDDCSGSYSYHFSQAYMNQEFLAAGMHIYAQYWSRDPGFPAPDNIGLTDALHFVIGP